MNRGFSLLSRPLCLIACVISSLAVYCGATLAAPTPQAVPAAAFQVYLPLVRGASTAPAPPAPPSPVPGGALPASLARQWFTGNLTTISFYDPTTGAWSQPSGLGELYRFAADGGYTYAGSLKIQNGACLSEVAVYQTGVARAAAGELELQSSFSRTRTRIICGGVSESVSEALPAIKRVAYRVAIGPEGRTELTLGAGNDAKTFALLGIDEQLLGAWQVGGVSSQGFYDPATGQWAQPTAPGEWYRFAADGRFTYGRYIEQQDEEGCTISAWAYQEGEFGMSGSRLTIRFTAGRGRLENSCLPDEVQDEPFVITKQGEYAWQRLSDGQIQQLRLLQLIPFQSWTFNKE
jgi:hypothetical protein